MQEHLAHEISVWLRSDIRAGQIAAARYLAGRHDILSRRRSVIGRDGRLEPAENLPNNRLVDNQYGKLVRQKLHYLTGRAFHFHPKNETLEQFFTQARRKTIRSVMEDALSAGTGWLMPCFDGAGRFLLKRVPPYEVLPFWADGGHTVLDCAARVYEADVRQPDGPADMSGRARFADRAERNVELYTPKGMRRFILNGGKLEPAEGGGAWIKVDGRPFEWGAADCGTGLPRVPLVAFRSPDEQPLLCRVKSLQDALNTLLSDYQNALQEDARNTVLVLKNYDGADLAEFRHNLAAYGAVKVKTVDNSPGGVETLRIDFNHESYTALAGILKRAIIENGMGFDIRDGTLRGAPNQMTLLSMYTDIELDTHGFETEWKASFEELLSFVRAALPLLGHDDPGGAEVVFERDRMVLGGGE